MSVAVQVTHISTRGYLQKHYYKPSKQITRSMKTTQHTAVWHHNIKATCKVSVERQCSMVILSTLAAWCNAANLDLLQIQHDHKLQITVKVLQQ